MWNDPADDRPRERVLRHGPRRLTDAELLALVLRHGRRGENAVDLARTLLGVHGDIGTLAATRPDVLADLAGIGPAKAAAVAAAFELGRRTADAAEAVSIRCAADVVTVARREARGVRHDELLVFVTDVANRVRWTVSVATGSLSRVTAPVGRVIAAVAAHGGYGFALARLVPAPGVAVTAFDRDLVRRLGAAATYAELRFLDYVLVGDVGWCGVLTDVPGRTYDARAGP